jgi:hypothetical protein
MATECLSTNRSSKLPIEGDGGIFPNNGRRQLAAQFGDNSVMGPVFRTIVVFALVNTVNEGRVAVVTP